MRVSQKVGRYLLFYETLTHAATVRLVYVIDELSHHAGYQLTLVILDKTG